MKDESPKQSILKGDQHKEMKSPQHSSHTDNEEGYKWLVQLKETNNRFQQIFNRLNAGIWMEDIAAGNITFASKGLGELLQIPLETLYEKTDCWRELILPEYKEELTKKLELLHEGACLEYHYRIDTKGTTKWIYEQTIPRVDESGEITHIFGMLTNITAEKEMQNKLEFLAKNDEITALPNQNSLYEKLDTLIQDNQLEQFALLYVNLDNFEWIVDYLGYKIANNVIRKIAGRLIATLPKNGDLIKMDSDSFIFIVHNYEDRAEVNGLAASIIETIGSQIKENAYEFQVTASVGISFYPDNGESKLILLENARTALYHAKNMGKNNYQIYSHDKDISAHKKYMLEKDLREAIKNEEFELYYQPQINPEDGMIMGAEALIRWNHKEWGVISPGEFIPLAEKKHLIQEIGDWVIHTVCKQLQTWNKKGQALYPIAINVSPISLLKPEIVDVLKQELENHHIPAKYIEIEITENTLLKNEKNVLETLRALKELGVTIALDDFGTGYSSFHYLQSFEVNKLKIDQMFIRNLDTKDHNEEKKGAAIVSSFLHLSKGLNMIVVAEGVEELEQLEFLKQNNCDMIQGYLYSKPVPAEDFERLMMEEYLQPQKQVKNTNINKKRRKYTRFIFPNHLQAKMNITEVNNRIVKMGYATILVEDISLGGIKFLTTLSLPVQSNIKLNFQIDLMKENFELDGILVYKNEEKIDTYSYGVSFYLEKEDQIRLARIINRMIILSRSNKEIQDTDFVKENPYVYLQK